MKNQNSETEINCKRFILPLILMALFTLAVPLLCLTFFGKFTWNFEEAQEQWENNQFEEEYQRVAKYCEFMVIQTKYGFICDRPCIENSLDGKKCVPKGCIDSGFLGLGMDCNWYVCEGYGDIKAQCVKHWSGTKEEYCKNYPDDEWNCGVLK